MPYTIIRDTREKPGEGWNWRKSKNCEGTVISKVDTGDYTLQGYESLLSIERKGSVSEWAQNITQARFIRELERLESIRFPFILLEFTLADIMMYPVGSSVPKRLWYKLKVRGPYILKKMIDFHMKYKTQIILCGNHGKDVAASIFKRTIEIIEDTNE